MLLKRKLFSSEKKKDKEDKLEKETNSQKRSRRNAAVFGGAFLGGSAGLGGFVFNDSKYDKEKRKALNTRREETKKLCDEYVKVGSKINDTASEVKRRARSKYKPRNIIDKFANDLDINLKTEKVADFYRKEARARFNQAEKVINDKYTKAIKTAEKKYNKRGKKIAIGAALIGTAAGLGINQLVKNRYKKINRERRSKNKKS